MRAMADEIYERASAICRNLPEVSQERSGRHSGFKVRGRRFAWLVDDHHGDGRLAIHCRAAPGQNDALVADDTARFFLPPYLGPRGWVGMYLDRPPVQWDEVEELVAQSYILVAPKGLGASVLADRG
jgi:phosphoribosylglycinamide formyltransferase-1